MPSADAVEKYARAVTGRKVPAGELQILAAQRHLDDLAAGKRRGLRYDAERAAKAIKFFTLLRHSKGQWAGQPFVLSPWQAFIVGSIFGWLREDGTRRFREAYEEVPRKNGKALDVQTPVLTTDGWKLHGALVPGDRVMSPGGVPVAVLSVTEHYVGPCYAVEFPDCPSIIAHAKHEWRTERTWYTGRRRGSRAPLPLVETEQIAATLSMPGRGDRVHGIPVSAPLVLDDKALPIPPYTLGAWLGDGHSSGGCLTGIDEEIPARIAADGFKVTKCAGMTWGILGLRRKLRVAGLLKNKHIPEQYFTASLEQRLDLLRGLLDTDGHATRAGQIEFVSVKKRLAEDVLTLARTLGLKPSVMEDRARLNGRDCGPRYRIQMWQGEHQLFHLKRKAARARKATGRAQTRMISGATPIGDMVVNCIEVDGGFYLAGRGMVPTHNSTKDAGIGLRLAFFDGEAGAEVYCAATKRDQAKIIFEEARRMVDKTAALKKRIGVQVANLHMVGTASKLEPLGADADTLDGLNIHGAVVDEVHAHKTRAMIDVLKTATGARQQPLIKYVTTAGYDRHSVCWELHDYAIKVLRGIVKDDTFFAFIACADPKDDWRDPKTWAKANPNLGVSVNLEDLARKCKQAEQVPAQQNAFRRLHLNEWTEQSERWLDMAVWDKNAAPVQMDSFRRGRVFGALDAASVRDVTAFVAISDPDEQGVRDVLCKFWVPEDGIRQRSERDRVPYQQWADEGYITATPGNVTDYDFVERDIFAMAEDLALKSFAFDRWNLSQLVKHLQDEWGEGESARVAVLACGQGFQSMSAPTKELEKLLLAGKIRHGGNPVLRWMASNVAVRQDPAGNIKPDKEKSPEKIDGIVALVMALWLVTNSAQEAEKGPSVYESRGLLTF